jgi:hypothetical protein
VSTQRDARRLLAPAWRVTIAGHDVPPRWRVERQTVKLCAVGRDGGPRDRHEDGADRGAGSADEVAEGDHL